MWFQGIEEGFEELLDGRSIFDVDLGEWVDIGVS
jgi:hypothetical protein